VSEGSTSDGAGLWTVVVGALWSWLWRAVSASHHGLHGPPIGPGRAWLNGSCRAWHDRPEARPRHDLVRASCRYDPLVFVLHRARVGPIWSCFRSAY
jgi:hypothetical protein